MGYSSPGYSLVVTGKEYAQRTPQSSASPSVQSHLPCFLRLAFTAGEVKWFILGQSPGPRETLVSKNSVQDL